jgi:DNA-binding transcriptional LysR family regulator
MVLPVFNPGRTTETESLRIVEARILAVGGMSRLATAEVAGWNRFPIALMGQQLDEPCLVLDHFVQEARRHAQRRPLLSRKHTWRPEEGPACIPTWFSKAARSLTIVAMIAARTGVSVGREMAVEKRDGCRFLPLADESANRRVGIVPLKQHFRSHVHRAFLERLRPRIPPLANPA